MVTMARSKSIHGPYEVNPANPVLTNANTTNYCKQTTNPEKRYFISNTSQFKPLVMQTCSKTVLAIGKCQIFKQRILGLPMILGGELHSQLDRVPSIYIIQWAEKQ